jgi:hypothetical protein
LLEASLSAKNITLVFNQMEGKKRDRPPFFNRVFSQLIEDYRNNESDLSLNVIEAFKQLEAAEVTYHECSMPTAI